jgi:small-conductance mechanosensitive channel
MVVYSQGFVQFITALLILVIGLVLGKVLGNSLRRLFKGMELNALFERGFKTRFDAERVFSVFVSYLIYFVVFLLVLMQLGISDTTIKIIFLVFLGLVVLVGLLASKDWLPNLVAGLYLLKTKKIKVGDTLKIRGFEGKIVDLNLVETKIKTKKDEEVFIPNSLLNREMARIGGKK